MRTFSVARSRYQIDPLERSRKDVAFKKRETVTPTVAWHPSSVGALCASGFAPHFYSMISRRRQDLSKFYFLGAQRTRLAGPKISRGAGPRRRRPRGRIKDYYPAGTTTKWRCSCAGFSGPCCFRVAARCSTHHQRRMRPCSAGDRGHPCLCWQSRESHPLRLPAFAACMLTFASKRHGDAVHR